MFIKLLRRKEGDCVTLRVRTVYLQSFQRKPRFRRVFLRPDMMDCKDMMVRHLTPLSEGDFQLQRGNVC